MGEDLKYKPDLSAGSGTVMSRVKDLLMMFRVAHWVKNLFLYLPLFFAGDLFELSRVLHLTLGVVAFSLVSSGVYIMNDCRDIDRDRQHPVKQNRAIAAGRISVPLALVLMMCSLLAGFGLAAYLDYRFLFFLGVYFVLNVFYSFGLKNISILDVLIIAVGFVLRMESGGVLADVAVSHWLVIMVFLLAVFLALGKRRDDLIVDRMHSGNSTRPSISGYNAEFLNISLAVTATIMLMAYLMYTLSPEVSMRMHTQRLYYTAIFVGAGIMRYLQLIYIEENTRSPVRVLYEDRFIQICIALWVLSFYLLIYSNGFGLF